MRMLQNKNFITAMGCLVALAVILIICGIILLVVGMLIDHECYQLEPNDRYQSSICERYWDYDKN